MNESIRFYRDVLGFDVVSESEWFSELEYGGFRLGLHVVNEHMQPAAGIVLEFRCADLRGTYEAFKRKGVEITEPRLDEGMSYETCMLTDPNGIRIMLGAAG
jgi:catechol 2,3-dioxygenase-like lactoylglutathione lyase family enzyme